MFEFEDISSGFHDILLNKYTDSSGPILDFYISDSMQDMLDIDIRSEVATVVGGTNEFSSLINDLPSSSDLDIGLNDGEISWLGAPKWSATTDIYADVGACVNPNSVMPLITTSLLASSKGQLNLNTNNLRVNNSPPSSPKESKSHLTFSPHQIKVPSLQENKRPSPLATVSIHRNLAETVKKDLSTDLKDGGNNKPIKMNGTSNNILPPTTNILSGTNTIKLAPGIGGLTFSNSLSYNKLKQSNTAAVRVSGMNGVNNISIKTEKDSSLSNKLNSGSLLMNGSLHNNNGAQNSNKILSRSILVQSNKNITTALNSSNSSQHHHHHSPISSLATNTKAAAAKSKPVEHEYPKPAYSYSCLIALALKNSRSGSLPVSEIYSFMCEHFPYFKTAPSAWKNSVRHNLSLNKCFEKIEKPATNGNQRKGCLWAMNPEKILKMDDEVQKWSRKDPMAIRKAMVYPENLEALERGEMKHGSTGDSDGENDTQSDVEENSDSEQDQDIDDNLIETPKSVNDDEDDVDNKDFDIEVTDIYDAIDLEDNKESIQRAIQRSELLEMKESNSSSSKKARLDVNYSIGPAGIFERCQQQQQQQPAHHNRRKMQLVNRIA